eukprot:4837846-Amphidinium_carterae.1
MQLGASGDGGGNGGSGPSSSRGDPLHRKDPWYGATTQTRRAGPIMRASGGGGDHLNHQMMETAVMVAVT